MSYPLTKNKKNNGVTQHHFFSRRKSGAGFTLIELLVVITIIGIISGIVIVAVGEHVEKARDVRARAFSHAVYIQLGMDNVGWWRFDEGSGDHTYDASGQGNHGTIHGATWTDEAVFGRALNFDGAGDYVDLEIKPSLTPSSITIEAWVKADRLDSWDGIISNMPAWGTGFSLQIGTVQNIAAMVSGAYLRTTWTPETGVWYHIVATHNDVTDLNILYVNGVEERRMTRAITYVANARTQIGVFYTRTPPTTPILLFNGIIDEVRIYNQALQAFEIQDRFVKGAESLLANGQITDEEFNGRMAQLETHLAIK